MPRDMYYSGYNAQMDRQKLILSSNAPIGFPRSEEVYAITDNQLSLRGPPIEINHPQEYNSLKYRCNNGSETMKYGVAGVVEIDGASQWWITQYISGVDQFGTTITFEDGHVEKDKKYIVYYYARPATHGGMFVTPIQGDEWIPEASDILVRKNNDAMPYRFGKVSGDQANTFKYATDMIYNTGSSVPDNPSAMTYLVRSSSTTGTFRPSEYPYYIEEIVILFTKPGTWPTELAVCIVLDGKIMTKNFTSDKTSIVENGMVYIDFDSSQYPESSGPYTNTPGNLKSSGVNETQFFFDLYENINGKAVIRIPFVGQCNSSFAVLMGQYGVGSDMTGVDCYVRGKYYA